MVKSSSTHSNDDSVVEAANAVESSSRVNKKQLSRERSTEIILDEALKLFVQRGYANTSVEQIAEACKLTKGAVYHYYVGKEELLLALLDDIEQKAIVSQPMLPRRPEEPAAMWIDRYIRLQAIQARAKPDAFLFLVVLSADMSNSRQVSDRIDAIFIGLRKNFETIVRAGQKSGEFTDRMLADELGLFWVAVFSGNVLHWHRSGRKDNVGQALVRALRLSVGRALTSHL